MRFEPLEARLLLHGNATTDVLNANDSNVVAEPLDFMDAPSTTLAADVDGDGESEVVMRDIKDGRWYAANPSDADEMTAAVWGQWSNSTVWHDVFSGDFNGDGIDDLAGRAADGGWWVARSDGRRFYNEHWGAWSTAADWVDVQPADVNGDGLIDIVGRASNDGSWWVARSDGRRFYNEHWGAWSTAANWMDVHVADVNGDQKDDLAGRSQVDGTWWVARSDGARFEIEHWGTWSTAVDWQDVQPADVNGDGLIDIVGRASTDGTWWVARSNGERFYNEYWGTWSTAANWVDVHAADVNGDQKDDLVGRSKVDGTWWVARSDGARFENEHWGTWSPAVDWLDVLPTDVDGDGLIDLVGRASTDGSWWVAQNSEARRQAFSNQHRTSNPIGHLGEVKIFSRALTADEVAGPAEATPVAPSSGGGGGDIAADAVRLNVGTSLGNTVSRYPAGTTFVIAAGIHMRQTIRPRAGMTFYGEPGAVLDGGDSTNYAFVGAADNVTIHNLEVRNYRPSDFMGAITAEDPGNQAHNSKNWVLNNLYVHHNWSSGVNMGDNTTITSSRFVENGLLGIGGRDFVGGLIEGNEIIGNNSRSAYSNSHGGGVKISTANGLVIRNNVVADNRLTGLWCDGGCTNWTVEDNTVTDHYGRPGSGIMFEISSGAKILNNVVRGAGRPSPTWAWGAAILISTSSDVVVSGNVVSDANNGISVVYQDRSRSKNPTAHVDNITVVNNELWDSGMSENTLTGAVTDMGVTLANLSLTWKDNRYRGNRAPKFWWQNGTKTLAEWKAMGFDTDGTYER